MSQDLKIKASQALAAMTLPNHPRQLYPALHAVAASICSPSAQFPERASAIGAVFGTMCDALGIRYGSQYMADQLLAAFRDGRMTDAIERMKEAA